LPGDITQLRWQREEFQVPNVIVVCRGPNCRERGGLHLRKRLVELLRQRAEPRLVGYACFGQCDFGPNVAFFPEATWYGGLNAADAAERVVDHALGAEQLSGTPLCLPDDERREHLANIAELIATLERDRVRRRGHRWWWPF
jgi:(2Fe-2S) ferredoxin